MSYHARTPMQGPLDNLFSPPPVTDAEKSAYVAKAAKEAEAKKKAASGGGFWGAISNIFGGAAKSYASGLAQKGQPAPVIYGQQPSAIEKYLPYIVIGGAAIAIAVVVKSKKK